MNDTSLVERIQEIGLTPETEEFIQDNAGYGEGVAKTPLRVLKSVMVQRELRRLGFNEDDAINVMVMCKC